MDPDFRAAVLADEEPVETPAAEPEEREEAPAEEEAEEVEELAAEEEEEAPAEEEEPEGKKPTKAAAAAEEKKKWRGKVKTKGADGKDLDEEVELDDEEVARIIGRRRSLDRAAFGWSEKLKSTETELSALKASLGTDWASAVRQTGQDPFQVALAYLKEQVDFNSLPPEQKAQIQLAHQRQQIEAERQQFEEEKKTTAREAQKNDYRDRVLRELPAAMDKRGLVKHPLVMSLINDIGTAQMFASRSDFPDLENAAEETESLLREASSAWLDNLAAKNPAALMTALSPAVIKAVKAQALASAKKIPTRPAAATGKSPSAPRPPRREQEEKPSYKSPQEWRRSLIAGANGK